MAFDEQLADRVREALVKQKNVTEKSMFQGLCFMVDDKMCICVRDLELMCRIAPDKAEAELEKGNCRPMIHNGKTMKGYIFVDEEDYKKPKDFKRLIDLCLDFNTVAKASKRKKNKD
ncbi:TfoX/Sxy family protein [uncultured Chryseobacterium sp.]|uniref:TfoX/Sxy family protein n=1 Tax=uncultured Chryseobacterium sp. TaxID=259322 RepID=UPI0025ECCB78|nr:TfoX/Sxy family protein [uncultured Chryseobacterium sp.]